MVPKIKRKQAYFHDESTFFKAFQLKLEDNLFFFLRPEAFLGFFWPMAFRRLKNPKKA